MTGLAQGFAELVRERSLEILVAILLLIVVRR